MNMPLIGLNDLRGSLVAGGHTDTHFTVPKRQFIPMTFLQIYFAALSVWMRASGRAGAAVCGLL